MCRGQEGGKKGRGEGRKLEGERGEIVEGEGEKGDGDGSGSGSG